MDDYVSLIIDIEDSRKYEIDERNEIQDYMFCCIKNLNKLFGEQMECEVTFSAGDELQGLFINVTTAVMYFRLLEILLHPVRVRAGIGIGEWNVKVLNGLSTQQDGPAYHRAREAIREVHKRQLHNIRICSNYENVLSNHLLNASNVMKSRQGYKQNLILTVLELLYPFVKDSMQCEKSEIMRRILQTKFEYKVGAKKDKEDLKKMLIDNYSDIDPVIITGNMQDAEIGIAKKNMAESVAKMIGGTRQNAASIIKSGNSNKIRELDYMALQYIEGEYGERRWNY